MHVDSVGFIGGGRVTRFMLAGWRQAGLAAPGVLVADPDADVRALTSRHHPEARVGASNLDPAGCQVVFLAIHPPALGGVLDEIKDTLAPDAIVVSLAPKWTLTRISETVGRPARLARVIPNAPSIVGHGLNPVSFAPECDPGVREELLRLLRPLGACPEVPEAHLEAYAILAAMGPTYIWPQLFELAELGVSFGLDRPTSQAIVAAMAEGAARTMAAEGMDEATIADLVPVHPLREHIPGWRSQYREVLNALHAKLRP